MAETQTCVHCEKMLPRDACDNYHRRYLCAKCAKCEENEPEKAIWRRARATRMTCPGMLLTRWRIAVGATSAWRAGTRSARSAAREDRSF
eukprot:5682659-Pyramimonas_sp.AAC.1